MYATPDDAVREWAQTVGAYPRFINRQWLVTNYDSVVQNPHYRGPNQPYPGEDWDCEAPEVDPEVERWDTAPVFKVRGAAAMLQPIQYSAGGNLDPHAFKDDAIPF